MNQVLSRLITFMFKTTNFTEFSNQTFYNCLCFELIYFFYFEKIKKKYFFLNIIFITYSKLVFITQFII